MKIYDGFTFYNELDLLDIRLAELSNAVDHFIIVESTTTFQGQPKPLFLKDNWNRYSKYHDKIIHIVVDETPLKDPWQNEKRQRDAIMQGLTDANSDDFVIIGDVDELLRPGVVESLRTTNSSVVGFRVPYFNFKFNYMLIETIENYCIWNMATKVGMLSSPDDFRKIRWQLNSLPYNFKEQDIEIIEHAGWHFTYLGNNEFIKDKIKSFSHAELNTQDVLDKIDVVGSISRGVGFNPKDSRRFVPVLLDDYFPDSVVNNINQMQDFIVNGNKSARSYLPSA